MPGKAKSMIFLPGEEPGGLASGTKRLIDNTLAAAWRLAKDKIPVGNEVATVFPWMRYVREDLADDQRFIMKRANYAETFANHSSGIVKVYEIRLMAPGYIRANPTLPTDIMVKLDIGGQRSINEKWMPWGCLNTEFDRHRYGELYAYTWHLPVPYFLQRGAPFVMDVELPQVANVTDNAFFINLHGWGAKDREPIDLIKNVPANTDAGTTIYTNIAFDDDRDTPLRDCWIDSISFGPCEYPNDQFQFRQIRVRPQPPDGPRWHQSEYYDIAMLSDQVGVGDDVGIKNQTNQIVIHRPVVPYILEPKDVLNVELWGRTLVQQISDFTVMAIGTQEPRQ